jgi:hypothetical protein
MEKPVEPSQALFPRHTEPEDQCKEGETSGSIYLNHSATTGEVYGEAMLILGTAVIFRPLSS